MKQITLVLLGATLLTGIVPAISSARVTTIPHKVSVIRVLDGDTIKVKKEGKIVTVRLYGIDAPELPRAHRPGQPFSLLSQDRLCKYICGQDVDLLIKNTDRYGRLVGIVYTDTNVNLEMVKEGYAWAYRAYLKKSEKEYVEAENEAKFTKLGLWNNSGNPQAPWLYRKQYR